MRVTQFTLGYKAGAAEERARIRARLAEHNLSLELEVSPFTLVIHVRAVECSCGWETPLVDGGFDKWLDHALGVEATGV